MSRTHFLVTLLIVSIAIHLFCIFKGCNAQQREIAAGIANVRDYGARGDNHSDDTQAIQAALDTGAEVFIPPGTYLISRPLDLGASRSSTFPKAPGIRGAGRATTALVQNGLNVPILRIGGSFAHVTDIELRFATPRSPMERSSGIVFDRAQWFVISRVNILGAYDGISLATSDTGTNVNYVFNGTIEDIYINRFRHSAVDLTARGGGSGGMTIRNVWAISRNDLNEPLETSIPYVFGAMHDSVLECINCQGLNCPTAVYCYSSFGISIVGLHIEDCSFRGDYNGVIQIDGTSAAISNVTLYNNEFSAAQGSHFVLFRADHDATVEVARVTSRRNRVTSKVIPVMTTGAHSELTTRAVDIPEFVESPSATGAVAKGASVENILRRSPD